MNTEEQTVWQVTLTGPKTFGPSSPLLALLPWNQPDWRRITIQMIVGSDACPDWEHVNLCMTAIQDMISMEYGLITDSVLQALETHVNVVDVETFRGPPHH